MDGGEYRGEYVSGFLASDDLTTATEVQLRGLNFDGSTYRVLAVGERLVVDSVSLNNGASAAIVTLFQDENGDGTVNTGEELASASLAASSQFTPHLESPLICNTVTATVQGKVKAKASAASIGSRIMFTGRIIRT